MKIKSSNSFDWKFNLYKHLNTPNVFYVILNDHRDTLDSLPALVCKAGCFYYGAVSPTTKMKSIDVTHLPLDVIKMLFDHFEDK